MRERGIERSGKPSTSPSSRRHRAIKYSMNSESALCRNTTTASRKEIFRRIKFLSETFAIKYTRLPPRLPLSRALIFIYSSVIGVLLPWAIFLIDKIVQRYISPAFLFFFVSCNIKRYSVSENIATKCSRINLVKFSRNFKIETDTCRA